ncbi:galectin-related protein-like [Tachysurus vachellii]|uniref:galectin-related protein-like n=1 Tax=Tachysurus vachellii TaxID=175792 RepID=UPI00296AB622|nr:galectin-related protein-like [Tachysurus vachellii]
MFLSFRHKLSLDFVTGPNGDFILFHFKRPFGLFLGPACLRPTEGSVFDIFFVKNTEGYEIYVNGQKSSELVHHIPVKNITTLHISGRVIMNTVGIVANWSESTFGKELKTGISRTKRSDIQCDVPHPVCNPYNPYSGSIPGGLRHGVALFFQGVVPVDYECFEINLQTGPKNPHDIALQLKRSRDSTDVVLNSCKYGTWGNEEKAPGGPFVGGAPFDIIMVIKPKCYKVMVNGLEYCKFKHRIPVDEVTTLNISGDVFMNTFGITKVDDINLKVTVTNPANI